MNRDAIHDLLTDLEVLFTCVDEHHGRKCNAVAALLAGSQSGKEPEPPYVTCRGADGRIVIERDQFNALKVWAIDSGGIDGSPPDRICIHFNPTDSVALAKAIYGAAGLREPKEKMK